MQFEQYGTTTGDKNKDWTKYFKSENYKTKWTERKCGAFERPIKVNSEKYVGGQRNF